MCLCYHDIIDGKISAVFRTFHSLYFGAVCKLHTCCIRMNIICESLAKGREIVLIGRRVRKSMQLTVCNSHPCRGISPSPPQLRFATVVVVRLCLRLNT